jgi:hypothetical protein
MSTIEERFRVLADDAVIITQPAPAAGVRTIAPNDERFRVLAEETVLIGLPAGVPGPAGPTGPAGADGGSTSLLPYNFVASTVPPPGDGSVATDNASGSLVTAIRASLVASTGQSAQSSLFSVDAGDGVTLEWTTLAASAGFRVTGPIVQNSGYIEIPVAWIYGMLPPAGPVSLGILRVGPQGPQGIPGTDGADGVDGADGAPGPQGTPGDADGNWHPRDHGFHAWAYDPLIVSAGHTMTSGVLYAVGLILPKPASVTGIVLYAVTAGTGLTPGTCFGALYDAASGTLVGSTADQSAAWVGANGTVKKIPLVGGSYNLPAGLYYVAVYASGTTGPSWGRNSSSIPLVNINLPANAPRFGAAAGPFTGPPPAMLPTLTGTASIWAAVY